MIMWRAGSTSSPISNHDPSSIISTRHSRWVILPLAWRLSTHSLRFSSAPIACSSKNSCSRSGMWSRSISTFSSTIAAPTSASSMKAMGWPS